MSGPGRLRIATRSWRAGGYSFFATMMNIHDVQLLNNILVSKSNISRDVQLLNSS